MEKDPGALWIWTEDHGVAYSSTGENGVALLGRCLVEFERESVRLLLDIVPRVLVKFDFVDHFRVVNVELLLVEIEVVSYDSDLAIGLVTV